jgi:serpin B
MKTSIAVMAVFVIGLLMLGCSGKPIESDPEEDINLSVTDKEVIRGANNFGFNLFQAINNEKAEENVFISPLSVSVALGMVSNGAAGDTRDSILKVLDLVGLSLEDVNQTYRLLIDHLTTLDSNVAMEIANSNWLRQGINFKEQFVRLNRDYFDAEVHSVDFLNPATLSAINNWVSEKTHGKIKKILNGLDPLTILILINAVYFKGSWTYEFDPEYTENLLFYPANGSTIQTATMSQRAEFLYYQNESFQSVDLPYGDEKFSMTIFLPSPSSSVDEFIGNFSRENFEAWLEEYHRDTVNLYLPKFELELKYKLNDVLTALGMGIAFVPSMTGFANIVEGIELYISQVIHKTYVKVDEEGTEAAAVTAVVFGTTSGPPDPEIFMRIDRPFVFVIRDNTTNAILFMGKILNPQG